MRNQTAAAERKAKRAASAGQDPKPKCPKAKPAARGRPAKKAKKAAEGGKSPSTDFACSLNLTTIVMLAGSQKLNDVKDLLHASLHL